MAIYHLSAKPISRATGRSATGAAAYRAGVSITDERTGLVFDFRRRRGVDHREIMAPANAPEWAHDRAKLWNAVELAEKRKDSQVAREVEVALPTELTPDQQRELVRGYVRSQFVALGMVADITIHHATGRNPHAHILLTMRDIGPDGFGQKNRSWNDTALLQNWRVAWEVQTNLALQRAGHSARIDHRTLAEQGIEREPTRHLGPAAIGYERRTGRPSDRRIQQERAMERLARAKALGELERQSRQSERLILDLSGDLSAAKAERDRQLAMQREDAERKAQQAEQERQQLEQPRIQSPVAPQIGGLDALKQRYAAEGVRLYTPAEKKAPISLNVGGKVQPCYSGRIVEVGDRHVIQMIGANVAIAHERGRFDDVQPVVGKSVKIVYADGKARNVETPAINRDRQRGR